LLRDLCRSSFRCRRGHCCHGFSTQAKLFRQRRPVLGIHGGRERMTATQPPPPPILVAGEAVAHADMAAQSLAAVAAIETNHVVTGAPIAE
jgi:hypothetical protein